MNQHFMKKGLFKKLLPHLIAIVVFLVIALIYCRPVLEGKVINQHDVTHWKGAIQNSVEYTKTHNGNYPLWSNGLFSGMPLSRSAVQERIMLADIFMKYSPFICLYRFNSFF
jgi:hypothetical protein